jgi:hypothetical protein
MIPVMKRSLDSLTGFGDSAPHFLPVNADLFGFEYNEFLTIWIGFEENRSAPPCLGDATKASGGQPVFTHSDPVYK